MRLKIQSMKALRAEMLSVARGGRKAPAGARQASFESVEAVMRLLTPENRQLLAAIEREKPASVADLARSVEEAEAPSAFSSSPIAPGTQLPAAGAVAVAADRRGLVLHRGVPKKTSPFPRAKP